MRSLDTRVRDVRRLLKTLDALEDAMDLCNDLANRYSVQRSGDLNAAKAAIARAVDCLEPIFNTLEAHVCAKE